MNRNWRPEVAVLPRAIIDGDRVRITGFRNFEYHSRDNFTARYEEREFLLSHLTSVDFFVSYIWLLLIYLERINELADQAEFYHLLSNRCTIDIVRYANRTGRVGRLDFRHVINGFIDRYLYHSGMIDSTLPFEELRRRSWTNDAARSAGNTPEFSQRIRASLPGAETAGGHEKSK